MRIKTFEIEKVKKLRGQNESAIVVVSVDIVLWIVRDFEHRKKRWGDIVAHSRAINRMYLLRIRSGVDIKESCDMVINSREPRMIQSEQANSQSITSLNKEKEDRK